MALLVFLLVCVAVWVVARSMGGQTPPELALVVRVRNAAPVLEMVLREVDRTGLERVTVVDEGSTDGSDRIAALWASSHPGLTLSRTPPCQSAGVHLLVLDLREPERARTAMRTLGWLGGRWRP